PETDHVSRGARASVLHAVARWLAPALLGMVAFALVLQITEPPGPGLDPDALAYMGSAESFARLGEFRAPTARWWSSDSTAALAHFPPGFATVLAAPVRLGMDPMQGARLVQALCAVVIITTLVLLVSEAASPVAAVLLATGLFSMASMHEVHVSVLSEPLFLALLVLALFAMVRHPERPWLAGLAGALATLTRYAGISIVGAVALWSVMRRGTLAERLRNAALALLPTLVLQGLWFVRTRQVGGAGPIRTLSLYGNLGLSLEQGAKTLAWWLVPNPDEWNEKLPYQRGAALAAGFVILLIAAAGAWREHRARMHGETASTDRRADGVRLLAATGLLIVSYLGVLVASRVVADPNIPFDERILAPVMMLGATLAATGIALWWRSTTSDLARIAVVGALLGWWAAAASHTRNEARWVLDHGSDFASDQWRNSALIDWARTEGTTYPLYTNWPVMSYFYLRRPARDVPRHEEIARMTEFVDSVRVRGGRILAFTWPGVEYVPVDSLVKVHGLRVVTRRADGVVLAPVDAPYTSTSAEKRSAISSALSAPPNR
ncbi:MAG TPA: glycosyltransferase family 39 protein, partial [Gemmatimonadaceae bacterium]|nr:glycosyltransferase family 39 protein [Gemmatimonadaceae bacterium]